MKKGDLLFVYGTLLRNERADITKKGMFNVAFIAKDEINGLLYHLGGFPGLKLVGDPTAKFCKDIPIVHGEVYFIGDSSVPAFLDAYESYHYDEPEKGLYNRHKVWTRGDRNVWAYTYNHHVIEDQIIETGDWRNPRLQVTRRVPRTN